MAFLLSLFLSLLAFFSFGPRRPWLRDAVRKEGRKEALSWLSRLHVHVRKVCFSDAIAFVLSSLFSSSFFFTVPFGPLSEEKKAPPPSSSAWGGDGWCPTQRQEGIQADSSTVQ